MNRKGFTLIEVMVTVTIIALLSVMVISGYSQTQKRARDARRIADVGSLGIALESYYASHGSYPGDGGAGVEGKIITSNLVALATEGLINNLPVDPKPDTGVGDWCRNYAYKRSWASGTKDTLYSQIDNADSVPNNATFNGVVLGPRQWVLYMASEVAGTADYHHPLDSTLPAMSNTSYCSSQKRGYALLLGPLQNL